MILTDIRLQQYRSYQDASFKLGSGVNIVVGPNAVGKTNLLEAIMVACIGKSYRARDQVLMQNEQTWSRIDVHTDQNILRTVKLQTLPTDKLTKTYTIDEKEYKRLPDSLKQPIVLFEPNDLQLIEGEPTLRRSYLDDIIEQYSPGYEKYRNHYKRVLAQRNALLKQGPRAGSQLFAWNLRLADLAGHLVNCRLELIAHISDGLNRIYTDISGHDKSVSITYDSTVSLTDYSTNLLKKLEATNDLDLARGFTGNGPHRDDFTVNFSDQPALLSASRGEIRTLLLALKVIELQVLEKERGIRPLLLLDDVFSELDGARRKALTRYLKDYQTIITTTDADIVVNDFSKNNNTILLTKL